jgi:hypothetical protein
MCVWCMFSSLYVAGTRLTIFLSSSEAVRPGGDGDGDGDGDVDGGVCAQQARLLFGLGG